VGSKFQSAYSNVFSHVSHLYINDSSGANEQNSAIFSHLLGNKNLQTLGFNLEFSELDPDNKMNRFISYTPKLIDLRLVNLKINSKNGFLCFCQAIGANSTI
jgi:hypothetical protein